MASGIWRWEYDKAWYGSYRRPQRRPAYLSEQIRRPRQGVGVQPSFAVTPGQAQELADLNGE